MTVNHPEQRNPVVGGLLVLLVRGVLLWLVVPLAALVWLFVAIPLRRSGVRFLQYLGWVDLNLLSPRTLGLGSSPK